MHFRCGTPLTCWQIFQQLPEEKSSTSTFPSPVFQQGQYPVIEGTLDHLPSTKRLKLSVPFNFGNDRPPLVPHGETTSFFP
jgi:hypothetical protein